LQATIIATHSRYSNPLSFYTALEHVTENTDLLYKLNRFKMSKMSKIL